jgi:hypothetical protein
VDLARVEPGSIAVALEVSPQPIGQIGSVLSGVRDEYERFRGAIHKELSQCNKWRR